MKMHKFQISDKYFTHKFDRDKSHKEPVKGIVDINISSVADEIIAPAGRMLSQSKSAYYKSYPDHDIYFNACLWQEDGTEIWFGDIDYTKDAEKLQMLANKLGETIILTPEHPFRFEGLKQGIKKSFDKDRIKYIRPRPKESWNGNLAS